MIYVNYSDLNKPGIVGIKKKILAQCHAFEKEFKKVYYTIFTGTTMYLLWNSTIMEKEFAVTKKECNDAILKWLVKYNIKKAYIRYALSDIWFVRFLKELKRLEIKRVLEFPTIPYDGEGWVLRPIEDKYYRNELYKYIDCCTTYSNYKTVFKIPCITLINGVDINEHPIKKCRKKDENLIIVAVATLSKWHGYERVIQGIHNYYLNGGEKNILFNIVGEGNQLQYYRRIVNECGLNEHVLFCGKLEGEELDRIYDNSDIAIGSLGFYKAGLQSGAPIKLREYCARGIPFVYGYDDISFSSNNYFGYQVPNDATPIDMQNIIHFYEQIYNGRDFIKDMRQYTLSNLTWDKILQPVMEYLS